MQRHQVVEPALLRDLALLENLDDRIEHDPQRKIRIGRRRLIGLITARQAAERQVGERRHAGAMRELGRIPRGLDQRLGVERRQFGDERQRCLDLLDLAGRLAVLLDDALDRGVVLHAGNLERLAVRVVDVHRQVFDEDRMTVGDRIEIGAGQRRVAVELRLIAPGNQPPSVGGDLRGGIANAVDDRLLGFRSLDRRAVRRNPVEPADIDAFPKYAGDLRMHVRFDEARDDDGVFEAPVDLDLLGGDPAAHLVERADAQDLAVHHRHRLHGGRAGIERDDRPCGVDGDLLRRRIGRGAEAAGAIVSMPRGSRASSV